MSLLHSPQRINVALTHAKRIFQIVGDVDFWIKGQSQSIIGKLVWHCKERGIISLYSRPGTKGKKQMEAWIKQNWDLAKGAAWKPNMTASFHYHVQTLHRAEKKMCSTCSAEWERLALVPQERRENTKMANDRAQGAQTRIANNLGHQGGRFKHATYYRSAFARDRDKCLRFIYTHPALPKGSACVKRDLSGVERPEEGGGGAVLHGVVVG